ncbi:MAG: ATP-binding cassette domain-containing protein, partial [Hydrogenoanaerobacterium sp.]
MSLYVEIRKKLGAFNLEMQFSAENEILALLGASGAGKSVALRCIAGIMTPDEGRIVADGQVLYDSTASINLPPQQRKVGYLFQQYALFPNMTVRQNIA